MSEMARQGQISVVENGVCNRRDDLIGGMTGNGGDYSLHFPRQNGNSVAHAGTVVALDDGPAKDFQHLQIWEP